MIPVLAKLFASTDRSVRRSLLESIDTYGPHLTQVRMLPVPAAPEPSPGLSWGMRFCSQRQPCH